MNFKTGKSKSTAESFADRACPKAVLLRFKGLRQRLGLPDSVTAHAYRHTYITGSNKNGVDMNTVAELVGHANAKMINEVYAHLGQDKEHLAQAAAKSIFRSCM